MGLAIQNNFTCGEIDQEAWDRVDIQPIQKGVASAINGVCKVAGPIAKRRGFWRVGSTLNAAVVGRLLPFVKSVNDALMIELGDGQMRLWNANGTPLMNGGVQFTMATPYAAANLPNLRWKQVGDVLYLFSADGLPPYTLERNGSNTSWVFTAQALPNGPWLPENTNQGWTLTISGANPVADEHNWTGAQYSPAGQGITLTSSQNLFTAAMVGSQIRLRANPNSIPVAAWTSGGNFAIGAFCTSVNNLYACTQNNTGQQQYSTNPPVHTQGTASDGANTWQYIGDGAGIVQITAVQSPTQASATILTNVPFGNAATSCWSQSAYSSASGWPSAWPTVREERLCTGDTSTGFDWLDLTETAGFLPTSANYRPGAGTGAVLDTDAIRRRVGDDGAPILWLASINYLVCATETTLYLVAGQVLDQPLTPASVTIKPVDGWGSEPIAPVKAWDGLMWVAQGAQAVRMLRVDNNQNVAPRELTTLTTHINVRGFAELAWVRQPDNTLWARLADGGLAAYVYQQEQQVEGWFSQQLGGGAMVESVAVLPGPFKRSTLWLMVKLTTPGGVVQRAIWFQSTVEDALFYDGAQFYQGAASNVVNGLDVYDGFTLSVMADGYEYAPQLVQGGQLALPNNEVAGRIVVGLPMPITITTLRLNLMQPGGTMNDRVTVKEVMVSMLTADAYVGQEGQPAQRVLTRRPTDAPGSIPRRVRQRVTICGDTETDPRIVITDSTGYDFRLYSLRILADDDEAL